MPIIVPNAWELEILQLLLNTNLTMKLYSNNVTPVATSTAASFIEVAGAGYLSKALVFANWVMVAGAPSVASYNATQNWTFTGATTAPGTIFGYYVTRNSDSKLLWAERFPAGVIPFVPEAGSQIRVLPRFTVESQF